MQAVIARFHAEPAPIFVVYGAPPDFEAVRKGFREHFQRAPACLYLIVDMGLKKRETPGETCFESVRQLIDALIDAITEPAGKGQLLETFRLLVKVQEKTGSYAPEDTLAEFVRFAELSCYPTLGDVLDSCQNPIIIEFRQFEKVAAWGAENSSSGLTQFPRTPPPAPPRKGRGDSFPPLLWRWGRGEVCVNPVDLRT